VQDQRRNGGPTMVIEHQEVVIYADTQEGGRAAAKGYMDEMERRGVMITARIP
jgi:hypothetical protein